MNKFSILEVYRFIWSRRAGYLRGLVPVGLAFAVFAVASLLVSSRFVSFPTALLVLLFYSRSLATWFRTALQAPEPGARILDKSDLLLACVLLLFLAISYSPAGIVAALALLSMPTNMAAQAPPLGFFIVAGLAPLLMIGTVFVTTGLLFVFPMIVLRQGRVVSSSWAMSKGRRLEIIFSISAALIPVFIAMFVLMAGVMGFLVHEEFSRAVAGVPGTGSRVSDLVFSTMMMVLVPTVSIVGATQVSRLFQFYDEGSAASPGGSEPGT